MSPSQQEPTPTDFNGRPIRPGTGLVMNLSSLQRVMLHRPDCSSVRRVDPAQKPPLADWLLPAIIAHEAPLDYRKRTYNLCNRCLVSL